MRSLYKWPLASMEKVVVVILSSMPSAGWSLVLESEVRPNSMSRFFCSHAKEMANGVYSVITHKCTKITKSKRKKENATYFK